MKKQLAIIFGGKSGEHEVSIKTAFSILQSLNYSNYEVTPIYVNLNGEWFHKDKYTQKPETIDSFMNKENYRFLDNLFSFFNDIDVAFPVIHGPNGEDGTLQGMLELLNIPYVGSSVAGSAIGMDKALMKTVFYQNEIPQGDFMVFTRRDVENNLNTVISSIESTLTYPMFIKPANLGSSIGISKAKNTKELVDAIHLASKFDYKIIIEAFISGREVEIGVLGHSSLITSEVGEITTTKEFYDYEAKYEDQNVTKLHIPAQIPSSVKERMSSLAKKSFQALECSGLARVDFFWDEINDKLYINEINTLPGFTPFSMYPMLFNQIGISYSELIDQLIQFAFEKHQEKQKNQIAGKVAISND